MSGTWTKRIETVAPFGFVIAAILLFVVPQAEVEAFTLNVQDPEGNPVAGFRWLLEEDNTHPVTPGAEVADSLAVGIHKSYAPVVAEGHSDTNTVDINVPGDVRYVVSVLPDANHTMSAQNVAVGQDSVTVTVNPLPLPTAQISILVFHDNHPLNNAPDPAEEGLENFSVRIFDIAGHQTMDAFGNMLGTTYMTDLITGEFILDGDGNPIVDQMGDMIIETDENGEALVKYLAPGKYGVQIVPPADETGWIQTSTKEGTPTVDAWVKANEPPVFVEFAPAGVHVFFGFVKQLNNLDTLPGAGGITSEITGRVVFNHFDRPPNLQGFWPGEPVPNAWVGLNSLTSFEALYAAPCNDDSTFSIPDVPPGQYQLVTWDEDLDSLFGFNVLMVPLGGGIVDLNDILAFRWFGTLEGSVFLDLDEDGFRDPGEMGIRNQAVNIRFRDGTVYQATETDPYGNYEFGEVFPFFKWLVVEVDFARHKATGATSIVDYGGQIPPDNGWIMPSRDKLNPQPQDANNPNTGNNLSLTEAGEVLTRAMHLFLGQINIIEWGKMAYGPGQNGGISGIVYYAVTRAEDDPRYAAGEEWEPGIPNVQVALYADYDCNGVIDDLDGDGEPTLADRDNYPLGWFDDPLNPAAKGPEDIDRNSNGFFDPGDALQVAHTDSWDDSNPCGCIQDLPVIHGQEVNECFDNFGTWNQVRPGIFDGGYAFTSYYPGGMASGSLESEGLSAGTYIVEAATPFGYELLKEEDKNVDFGDAFIPSPLLLPPVCVGDLHTVPDELTLFPGVECAYAGQERPLADRKQIRVADAKNAAADFFFFTEVPKAARAVGFINNDLAAEFDPCSPVYGEKSAPSWIPISFQDFAGNELVRIYSDEFGAYNAMLPSTYTNSLGAPSGMSPQMLTFVINHPGPIPDPNNPDQVIIDPYFDPDYSQTPYTFNFMPATTTYLDTPVIPVAAFVGYPNRQLDIEPPDGSPVIYSVEGPTGGPIVCTDGPTVTITSVGSEIVPNPDYVPDDSNYPELITRDFGFGAVEGTVTVDGTELSITSWNDSTIQAAVDFNSVSTGRLVVTRGDNGLSTDLGITLHVGGCDSVVHVSGGANYPNTPIQDAIDAADDGTLIIIEPGYYWENPIVWKNVSLQGSGAESTIINGNPVPTEKVTVWHDKIAQLVADGNIPAIGADFEATESPGILVYANLGVFNGGAPAIIDGLQVTGAVAGGGIYINGNADYLQVSNNKIKSNQGTLGGGITVGVTEAGLVTNMDIKIHYNHILKNGGINGAGGVTILSNNPGYQVTDNLIMGNFTRWSGGGVAHYGLNDGGLIAGNRIVSNEVFYGGQIGGDGGGIFIGSRLDPEDPGEFDDGSGSVTILSNLIQGNLAGSGLGGGICVKVFNGQDTLLDPNDWYELNIFNNIIVNNVAANAAGGIYLQDAARVNIINDTIANNDSTATAADTFTPGNLLTSTPQPAGIVASAHSNTLAVATGQSYSNPILRDSIIWGNRSFSWDASLNGGKGGLVANPTVPTWDLGVINLPVDANLNPDNCLLTQLTYADGADYNDLTNVAADPNFVLDYLNNLVTAAVIDEGGNFITVRFEPIGIQGDYHITSGSPAIDIGGGYREGTVGNTSVFSLTTTTPNRRAMPYTMLEAGTIQSITMYHEGGTGDFLLAVYDDDGSGRPGSRIAVTSATPINSAAGWQTVGLISPVDVSGGETIWLAWVFENNPGIRYITGAPGRAHSSQLWAGGMPTTFGASTIANYVYSIYATYTTTESGYKEGTVGNTDVFSQTTTTPNRRAMPHTMPEAGTIESITMYHQGGTGDFLLAVYDDDGSGRPGSRIAVTPATPINGTAGWQTVGLTSPVDVSAGEIIWLAWVFENNPGIRYRTGTPGRAQSSQLWAGGMPGTFGASTVANYIYSIYATYTSGGSGLPSVDFDELKKDYDWQTRPAGAGIDAGADEVNEVTLVEALNLWGSANPGAVISLVEKWLAGNLPQEPAGGDFNGDGVVNPLDAAAFVEGHPGVVFLAAGLAQGSVYTQAPADTDGIDTDGDGDPNNDNVSLHMAAGDGFINMADGRLQYMFGFSDVTGVSDANIIMNAMLGAAFPAPTITVKEGQNLYLNLTNVGMVVRPDLFDPHTIHWHGFPQAASIFDGVPSASISVNMGATLTYFYNVVEPGTFMWHCHVEATEHMQMGMLGNLWVEPKQNNLPDNTDLNGFTHHTGYKYVYNDGDGSTYYDVDYPIQIHAFDPDFHDASYTVQPLPFANMDDKYPMLNGRGYPDTVDPNILYNTASDEGFTDRPSQKVNSLITATQGEKILLRISSLSVVNYFTLTVLGIPMRVVGTGARLLRGSDGKDTSYMTNSVNLGGGETADVILDTTNVEPGTYFLYCTNLNNLSNNEEDYGGMMTEIVIQAP